MKISRRSNPASSKVKVRPDSSAVQEPRLYRLFGPILPFRDERTKSWCFAVGSEVVKTGSKTPNFLKISMLKCQLNGSIQGCWNTASGGRKQPEGVMAGAFDKACSRQGCRVKTNPRKG